jgi:hypothetical protein
MRKGTGTALLPMTATALDKDLIAEARRRCGAR